MWSSQEPWFLSSILEQASKEIAPGDVALWLAEQMKTGKIIGIELAEDMLAISLAKVKEKGQKSLVEFQAAENRYIGIFLSSPKTPLTR